MFQGGQVSDPASLSRLADVVAPQAVPWWPPAPGWYLLAGILFLLSCRVAWRSWRRWQANAYRREALSGLRAIRSGQVSATELPALLKRTALCAWPRTEIAPLNGPAWHEFLDRSGGQETFSAQAGDVLSELAYQPAGEENPPVERLDVLFVAAEHWIRRHQREAA